MGLALLIGLGVTLLSVLIGVSAGFFGVSRPNLSLLINVFLLIPGLPLMIVLAALYHLVRHCAGSGDHRLAVGCAGVAKRGDVLAQPTLYRSSATDG